MMDVASLAKFEARINKNGPVPEHRPEMGPCWIWTGGQNGYGYARFRLGGRHLIASKLAYQHFVGPVVDGNTVDHTCHNDSGCPGGITCPHRRCVNPAHLESVTSRENTLRSPNAPAAINARKTHCIHGHPFDADNTRFNKKNGNRWCAECSLVKARAWYWREREARAAWTDRS